MITLNTTEMPFASSNDFCMAQPAALRVTEQGSGLSIEGRHAAADLAYTTAIRVPAFRKDVPPGVCAWSPPV